MDPLVTSSLIKAGGSLLGGLLGGGGDDIGDQIAADKIATKNRGRWIVKGAKKAGFNPLTYLMSGMASGNYSGGGSSMPALSSGIAAAAGHLGDMFERNADEDAEKTKERAKQQLQRTKEKAQGPEKVRQVLGATEKMQVVPDNVNVRPEKFQTRPVSRQDWWDGLAQNDTVPMRDADGSLIHLRKAAVDRLNGAPLSPTNRQLVAEDHEMLVGDAPSEVMALTKMDKNLRHQYGGVMSFPSEDTGPERDKRIRQSLSFGPNKYDLPQASEVKPKFNPGSSKSRRYHREN